MILILLLLVGLLAFIATKMLFSIVIYALAVFLVLVLGAFRYPILWIPVGLVAVIFLATTKPATNPYHQTSAPPAVAVVTPSLVTVVDSAAIAPSTESIEASPTPEITFDKVVISKGKYVFTTEKALQAFRKNAKRLARLIKDGDAVKVPMDITATVVLKHGENLKINQRPEAGVYGAQWWIQAEDAQ